ncbi:hypothetical protein E2C01_056574 [Portunus trituberculatus]|uniref:Uncharacterized protein n=1 Tax=Portunus trituberculatus TaxID=210409 RepID=A0A5B7GY22_PORTR|nr:hypothetical protein [Portunus trituberculatus]
MLMQEGQLVPLSLVSSIGPLASQLRDSFTVNKLETQLSNAVSVMSQMASFLGMSGDSTPASLKEIMEEIVVNKLANHVFIPSPPRQWVPCPLYTSSQLFAQEGDLARNRAILGKVMLSQDGVMGLERVTHMSCLSATCDGMSVPAL